MLRPCATCRWLPMCTISLVYWHRKAPSLRKKDQNNPILACWLAHVTDASRMSPTGQSQLVALPTDVVKFDCAVRFRM